MCVCMCLRICGCIDSFTSSNGVYVSKTDTALPLRTEEKVWVQSKFSLQLTHVELWMATNRRVVPPWSKEQPFVPLFSQFLAMGQLGEGWAECSLWVFLGSTFPGVS